MDDNILDVEISEVVDNGNIEICTLLTIGETDKNIEEYLKTLSTEDIINNNYVINSGYEIILTKENLHFLLKLIELTETKK